MGSLCSDITVNSWEERLHGVEAIDLCEVPYTCKHHSFWTVLTNPSMPSGCVKAWLNLSSPSRSPIGRFLSTACLSAFRMRSIVNLSAAFSVSGGSARLSRSLRDTYSVGDGRSGRGKMAVDPGRLNVGRSSQTCSPAWSTKCSSADNTLSAR